MVRISEIINFDYFFLWFLKSFFLRDSVMEPRFLRYILHHDCKNRDGNLIKIFIKIYMKFNFSNMIAIQSW